MAGKKRKKRDSGTSSNNRLVINNFLLLRLREGLLILILTLSGFLLLALATYHRTDPSWSNLVTTSHVQNAAGRAGAWIADIFLYLCGYLAYIIPLLLIYNAWSLFERRSEKLEKPSLNMLMSSLRILGFILIISAGAGLAGLKNQTINASMTFYAGGILGNTLGATMVNIFNPAGALLILIAILLIGLTLFTGLSWMQGCEWLGNLALTGWRLMLQKFQNMLLAKPQKPQSVQLNATVKLEVKQEAIKTEEEPPKSLDQT